jgi:thymidylate synthase (FAD)
MTVELIDCMGTDVSVVNAARVSFGKQRDVMSDADVRLLHYLAREGHWSPFAHAVLSLRITAPIFVARQLAKHQVGLAWNEISRRYVDDAPDFYAPGIGDWRHRPVDSIKQGSGERLPDDVAAAADAAYHTALAAAEVGYRVLLALGVAPEQARAVLPLATLTTWIWTGSLYAFARVCRLRLDAHAQAETAEVATAIDRIARRHFPHAWGALFTECAATDQAR